MKPQAVRILDVFLLGPLMIQASGNLSGWQKRALLFGGLLTITYNAANWLTVERQT